MSQTTLGDKTGITFQQTQKYENGKNFVNASRLQQVANVLMVKLDFFFDGGLVKAPNNSGLSEDSKFIDEFICSRDGIALAKAFGRSGTPRPDALYARWSNSWFDVSCQRLPPPTLLPTQQSIGVMTIVVRVKSAYLTGSERLHSMTSECTCSRHRSQNSDAPLRQNGCSAINERSISSITVSKNYF